MDDEAIRDLEQENARAIADRKRFEESEFDEDVEDEPQPSEEDIALKSLDKEHVEDYLFIRRAVQRTDLAERMVMMAVRSGLTKRS